jgi:nickel transport protein
MSVPARAYRCFWPALLLAAGAEAHDYWFEDEPGSAAVLMYRGHRFSEHSGSIEPYDPAIVRAPTCVNGSAEPETIEVVLVYPLELPSGCAGLVVVVDSGYWTETASGTFNAVPTDRDDVIDSWKSIETIKLINDWTENLTQPVSGELEIVPTENPFALEPGDKLRLIVTLNGEPAEGVLVAYHGDLRGVTDSQGHINIRIRHQGLQIVSAGFDQRIEADAVGRLVRTSVLQFDLSER